VRKRIAYCRPDTSVVITPMCCSEPVVPSTKSPGLYGLSCASLRVHSGYVSPFASRESVQASGAGHGVRGCFTASRSTVVAIDEGSVARGTASSHITIGAAPPITTTATARIHHGFCADAGAYGRIGDWAWAPYGIIGIGGPRGTALGA